MNFHCFLGQTETWLIQMNPRLLALITLVPKSWWAISRRSHLRCMHGKWIQEQSLRRQGRRGLLLGSLQIILTACVNQQQLQLRFYWLAVIQKCEFLSLVQNFSCGEPVSCIIEVCLLLKVNTFFLLQWCLCCSSWVLHCTFKTKKEISVFEATSWISYRSTWQWKLLRFFSLSPKSKEIIGSFQAAEVKTQFEGHFCLSLQGKEVQSSCTQKIQSSRREEQEEEKVWEHTDAHREAPTDSLTSGAKEEASRQRFSIPFCRKTLWGETYPLKNGSWLWGKSSVLWDKYIIFLSLKIVNWNGLCCGSTWCARMKFKKRFYFC